MDNNNNNPLKEYLRDLNKEKPGSDLHDIVERSITTAYNNYINYSKALNHKRKELNLNNEMLDILNSLKAKYEELISLLQEGEDSKEKVELKNKMKRIDNIKIEIVKLKKEIEIVQIQIEAMESVVKKEKELLVKAGRELPDISEIMEQEEQEGEEPDNQ